MTAVELLREAARLMRQRATAASDGPWTHYGIAGVSGPELDPVPEVPIVCESCDWRVAVTGCASGADAEHIASWHPAVALAIADWLDAAAQREQGHRQRSAGHAYADPTEGDEVYGALIVARAYLDGAS